MLKHDFNQPGKINRRFLVVVAVFILLFVFSLKYFDVARYSERDMNLFAAVPMDAELIFQVKNYDELQKDISSLNYFNEIKKTKEGEELANYFAFSDSLFNGDDDLLAAIKENQFVFSLHKTSETSNDIFLVVDIANAGNPSIENFFSRNFPKNDFTVREYEDKSLYEVLFGNKKFSMAYGDGIFFISSNAFLVEKAIALTVREADQMIHAASKAGKALMVAHVLPFFPEFAASAKIIAEGQHGRLVGAHFSRVISKPDWSENIGDSAKTGGPAIDLHIHDAHFIGLIAGVPGRVFANGITDRNETVRYLTTQYLYGDNGPAISCSSGDPSMPSRAFMHGFEIYLEKATLAHHSGGVPFTVYGAGKAPKIPKLTGAGDPVSAFTSNYRLLWKVSGLVWFLRRFRRNWREMP